MAKETREHLFFHCQESALIWKLSPVKWDSFQHLTGSFQDWCRAITAAGKDSNSQKGIQYSVYLLWQIWKARNLWQFQEQRVTVEEVVQKALQEWQEYGEILDKTEMQRSRNCKRIQTQNTRTEPSAGEIKICVASEIQQSTGGTGMGTIFRDDRGIIVLASADLSHSIQSPCIAELEAIRRALIEAKRRKIQEVELQVDVKTIVTWLQGKTPPVSEVLAIVEDVFLVKAQFHSCRFLFIHRKWNEGSHNLAKFALSSNHPQIWEDQFPQWLGLAL